MKPEPKVPAYRPRPRKSVPSADDAIRDAIVMAFCIAALALVYMFADLVRQAHP